jgi:hypothetical protein
MDILNKYNEDEIIKMVLKHEKDKEYRRVYYKNKYNNNEEYRNKKKEVNKSYMRKIRSKS